MQLHAITAAVSWVLGDNHDGFPAAFAQFAQAASPVALAAVWQGAAVALGLAASLRLAPRITAAHRFAAWTAAFAVVAALPFLPFVVHLISGAGATAPLSTAAAVTSQPLLQFDIRWALVIAALWLIASTLRAAQFAFHIVRLQNLWKSVAPIADSDLAGSLVASIPARRRVEICTTRLLDRPSVIGFFAPRILIPDWLFARLSREELRQVVLHEAEHLRRGDDWTNLLQKFCLVLFPLNPALAWMERRLCREREMACDEGVVRMTQAPRAYAACLAGLAERGLQRDLERRAAALSLAAWRHRPELVHRVHSILRRKPALNPVAARALVGVVGCGLMVSSVELACCPQMVAFVAEPKPQIFAATETASLDRVAYTPASEMGRTSGASGYRMIQAKAILPTSRGESAVPANLSTHRATQNAPAVADPEIASNDRSTSTPHETMLKAETPSAQSAQPAPQEAGPQYVVLAAWELVSAPPQNSRAIADYDTGAVSDQRKVDESNPDQRNRSASQQAANRNTTPSPAPAMQITVTRLILRIEPASSAAGSTASHAIDSNSGQQPAAIPFGNGWLIFQL
jgi:beta-lactamase regulating signal transducer with metallopeptidase domain